MAFNSNTAAKPKDDSWKAQGFINLYLPTKDGKRRKLGVIPLKDIKPAEASLRQWLEADETNLETLQSRLIVEYQSADVPAGAGFDLG